MSQSLSLSSLYVFAFHNKRSTQASVVLHQQPESRRKLLDNWYPRARGTKRDALGHCSFAALADGLTLLATVEDIASDVFEERLVKHLNRR